MKDVDKPVCGARCISCSKSPYWAVFELLSGFSFLFLFGAGFYLGPAAIMVAAIARLFELRHSSNEYDKSKKPAVGASSAYKVVYSSPALLIPARG